MTKGKNDAPATAATDPALLLDYGTPDKDGNRYRSEKTPQGTRVYLLTADGEAYSTLAGSEDEGKKTLAAHIGQKE